MTAVNFISNLPRDLRSGGFSAMNVAAREALEGRCSVHYAGPIDPPARGWRSLVAKSLKLAGVPRNFDFFSETRLARIAKETEAHLERDADLDFFHGFTPWIATRPRRLYVAWSDCSFRDYATIYHRRSGFREADLARIEAREAAWLKGAAAVAFTSDWAAARATKDYRLDPGRVATVGIFGETELPDADRYDGAAQFAFVSTDFAAKGGPVVLEAFRRLRSEFPQARLIVVGDSPANLDERGVYRAGFLRKEHPAENAQLRDILARSRAVVHPTQSDIAPLLAVEAAYFGCPVISANRFAIPEIVTHGCTGTLVDDPTNSGQVFAAMTSMLGDDEAYRAMRRAAWEKGRRDHLKSRFAERLWDVVASAMVSANPPDRMS